MEIKLSDKFTYKKLIRFTLPTILMMLFSSVYGVVDGLFVSNQVGSVAFASINIIMPMLMIFSSFGFMIGTGGSALVSKVLGQGDKEKANRYFSMLIYLVIILGVILTILGIIFLKPISKMLGAQDDMINYCIIYGTISFLSLTFYLLQNCFHAFLIVDQKPKIGLIVTLVAGITNMVLDYLFIYKFQMGVAGAALATGISEFLGGAIPFIYFLRNKNGVIHLTKTKFELKPILDSCSNGASEMLTHVSMSLVNILYNAQLMKYAGVNGVTAYGIIMYVNFVFNAAYLGYSLGVAPIISYNYGANNKEELKNIFKKSFKIIAIASLVLTTLAEIFAGKLAHIFVGYDTELLEMTTNAIRIFSIAYLISGYNIFTSSLFTALNNGLISALISGLRTLVFQVSTILILPKIFDLNGIWFAIVVADILALIVSVFFIVKNRKKYEYI